MFPWIKKKKQSNVIAKRTFLDFQIKADKSVFFENLSFLLSSGIDMLTALKSTKEDIRSPNFAAQVEDLISEVDKGSPLWKAIYKNNLLPDYLLSIIKIGEESGNLPNNLSIVVEQQKKDEQFKSRLRSASIYPVFVLLLIIIVGAVIGLFVLPRLSTVYTSLQVELPTITKILIAMGDFLAAYGLIAVPAFIAILLGTVYIVFLNKKTKHWGQNILYKIGPIRKLLTEVEMMRFGYLMGTLLESGFSILDTLQLVHEATTFKKYQAIYYYLSVEIERGNTFQQAFSKYKKLNKYITLYSKQLIISGEKSGLLAENFKRIGTTYEVKSEITTKNLEVLFEPLLLITVWLVVAFIALAVVLPIYSLTGSLSTLR